MSVVNVRGVSPPDVRIRPGETVVIIGRPGSGKSTLAGWLARDAASAIVYDTKGDTEEWVTWGLAGFQPCRTLDELYEAPRAMLVVKPRWLERSTWSRFDSPWGLALEHPFQRVPTVLIFDEVLNVFPAQHGHLGTWRILQQGRSRGHVPVILSQLANNIDTRLLRLCHHLLVMGPCQHKDDLSYLERATSCSVAPVARLARRQVAWWTQGAERWRTYDAIDPQGPHQLRPLFPSTPWPYATGIRRGWPWSRVQLEPPRVRLHMMEV